MDKLIDFLQKEVPSNAGDLNVSINNTLEIIDRTRAALANNLARLYQNGKNEMKDFQDAGEQLTYFENFLRQFIQSSEKTNEKEKSNILNDRIDYDICKVDETKSYNLDADFSKKRPIGFIFEGKRYDVQSWNRLLVMVCEILNEKNPKIFQSFPEDTSIHGRKRKYFIREESKYHKKVAGTGIWVLTNNDGSANCRTIIRMFEKYDIPITSMKIFIQSDYSLLDDENDDENIKKN